MIELEQLSVRFGGVVALDALDAVLDAPICGLIGPNGAGKTTLVNALCGFVRAEAQALRMDGVDLRRLNPVQRIRAGLRRSFQTEQVVEDLSVWANVQAVLDNVPHRRATAQAEVGRALEFTGLAELAGTPGRQLNLFQRRMVEVAKALVGAPKLLLLDEPGAGLTEPEAQHLRGALRGVADFCGAQVLLIDHDVELIRATCQQTLVLDFGRRLALGPTEEVLRDPAVRCAYLGADLPA